MKKIRITGSKTPSFWDKCLRFMKLTFLFLLVGLMQVSASVYSQSTKLSLEMRNAKVSEVLDAIESQSEFRFAYSPGYINLDREVSVDINKKTIEESLKLIFAGTGVEFGIHDRHIILYPEEMNEKETKTVKATDQQSTVSGMVTDNSGQPLPGVTIVVKGTTLGTVTDVDGKYKLNVPASAEALQFSFVGMQSVEVEINGRSTIDVTLQDETFDVDEVVVVGYGSIQKRELTSAVSSVSEKDLLQGAVNNPLQMMDGKVSGVSISNTAEADPNSGTNVQIRGSSSIDAGNGPLIIIDGVPGGNLRNIAQQDIESMTVLKDGSAAAIYGSRAANGVILIQTKRGKSGDVVITYDSYIDHDVVANRPDILSADQFLEHGIDVDRGARTDWYDELLRKDNFGQNHYISASGGNENTIFRISANFRDKTAIDIASDRQEAGIRASFEQKALDGFLELSGNLSYKDAAEEYTNYGVFQQAVKLNPTIPVYDENEPSGYYRMYGYDTYNPIQDLMERENGADQEYSIIDFNIKMNLLRNLNTEIKLARQKQHMYKREYYNSKSKESIDNMRTGRARLQSEDWEDYTIEWIGNYFAEWDKSFLKVMGGYSYQEFNNFGFWAENMDFISDAFTYNNLSAGEWNLEEGRLGMDSWRSKEKTIAFFGRANYSYDDLLLFTASMRYEGNSKFGKDNKWGMFPAASAAWRLSEMPFLEGSTAVDDLKVRLSYGETGRSGFGRYASLARYTGYGRWQNDEGEWIQVYGPANNPNPNLRWEKQISYNFGVDFELFNSSLSGSVDAFIRKGKDVISNYDAPVPPYLHDQIFTNVATTSSRGVELMVNWDAVQTNDFTYSTNVTASYIKSKLDKFSNETFTKGYMERYWLPSPGNPGNAQRLEDDTEIGSFYGYKYAGVDDAGNILVWENGEVGTEKIDASNEASDSDKTYLGHGSPRMELAWGNNFTYKNFDLMLYFTGRFDYQILNLYQMYYGLVAEPGVNLLEDAYGRNGHITSGKVITDYFLENGDYLKLNNLTLGWTPQITSKYISNLRVYGTVKNVFTLTNYSGLDPTTVNISGLEPGIQSLDVYPITRNYTLGVQITF
ncbi:TonB-linked outer membrane protein, SusC/RagA family [Tangfeifania diversioriginum]|uniref:TonB-linked outer membrane protein, SusC/RagA family n=2 Tax=Tangfeifania diversioriginum TaxID=1168035 RepID=A0A1M6MAG3_9BACT|nr:TonB-linked outer membrane protein, SusC/RagA family [Tangfeifania diversioriginum]